MSRNDSNQTYAKAVITAAYQGDVKTAIAQLGEGADVDARDCDGDTALMLAAERGHIELMKVLLKNGADVDAEEPQRRDRADARGGERPSGSGQNSACPSR